MDDTRKYRTPMILKPLINRLREAVTTTHVVLDVVQQDYILSWLLVGIFQHSRLNSTLVFKGGTALKKCYFGTYRFSEDLDFTARPDAPSGKELFNCLSEACAFAEKRMNEYAPIKLHFSRYEEKQPHPHGQEAFTIHAQFPWQKEPLTKAMIEVTKQEVILLQPIAKPLIHNYGEPIESVIHVYSLEEIILEKLRAILQHTKKLYEKDWERSRSRDYYDLWHIFKSFEESLFLDTFAPLLHKKCEYKQVSFKNEDSFFDPIFINNVKKTWGKYLSCLVQILPNCEELLNDLKLKIKYLLENSTNKIQDLINSIAQGKLKGDQLYEILDKFLHYGGNANQETSNGHRLLQLLIKAELDPRKKLQLIKLSVERGAKIDTPDKSTLTPYATAVLKNEKNIADYFRDIGVPDKMPLSLHPQYYKMYLRFPFP
jgi:predicted nucleotidyltransferase component of viral defense system